MNVGIMSVAALALCATLPDRSGAQVVIAPPPIAASKAAATRAVAATDAHTDAMTRDQSREQGEQARRSATPTQRSTRPAATGGSRNATLVTRGRASASGEAGLDSGALSSPDGSVSEPGARSPKEISLLRETFSYENQGRRDPFVSLMATGELRPMISDLRLATVIYDGAGKSVAILRDLSTKEQYRVTVGQTVGRMRVVLINPKAVTFTIEEFGYSRQEVLALYDPTKK